jgi:hypothetical protein
MVLIHSNFKKSVNDESFYYILGDSRCDCMSRLLALLFDASCILSILLAFVLINVHTPNPDLFSLPSLHCFNPSDKLLVLEYCIKFFSGVI